MLSTEVINSVFPTQTLATLQGGELENDVSIVFDWIKFAPPMVEPTPRIKSAIRSILKDEINQGDFVILLNNSINEYWNGLINENHDNFFRLLDSLMQYHQYYDELSKYLNFSDMNQNLFTRNINQNFKLLFQTNKFELDLRQFFESQFLTLVEIDLVRILKFFDKVCLINEVVQMLINIVITHVKGFIISQCQEWNFSILPMINQWLKLQLYPNFKLILKFLNPNLDYFNHLLKIAYNELVSLRSNQIFDIVLNYPKSEISLLELHTCLNYKVIARNAPSNFEFQRNKLVENFLDNCEKRLLNSGINTVNLIKIYIRIVKSFLIIDPKGVLLDKVIRPIRKYLKTRDDIIQKLVIGLIDDTSKNPLFELSKELSKSGENLTRVKDDYDLNWVPDPIDALADFKKYKINDIIESLISIFDNKEIFINEFTKLFGTKLININAINDELTRANALNKILRLIKLLKLRFGKNEFFSLDIMVQDILKSKKFQSNFNCLVISYLYWNDVLEDPPTWTIHPDLLNQFEQYNDSFKHNNYNRYLKLLPNLSNVMIKLNDEVLGVSLEMASIIYCFNNLKGLKIERVCELLNMTEYDAKKGLKYWVDMDVLVEVTPGMYIVDDKYQTE